MATNSRQQVQAPARKIGPTRRSVSGILAFRGKTGIPFESILEMDFLRRLEPLRCVLEVISQPVSIPFLAANGQEFRYTPDFLVYYRMQQEPYLEYPRPLLVEVKPEAEWRRHWQEWKPKWRTAHRYAREQGWDFRIFDETRIRDAVFENTRFLERFKRMSFPPEEIQSVLENLELIGCARLERILAQHFMGHYEAEGTSLLWHLVATGRIECDLSRPVDNFTELWVPTDA